MTGSSDSNRSESQGGFREELSTKEGRSKGDDRRNTNRQRGRMRAISLLGNAKSNRHRKTHQVEPDGTAPNVFMHLTRGDLRRESDGEVSRGSSSEDNHRKVEGAKDRRTIERATETRLRKPGGQTSGIRRARQLRQLPTLANAGGAAGLPKQRAGGDVESGTREKWRQERAQ